MPGARSWRPRTQSVFVSALRTLTRTSVPARTRMSGPGICVARPSSAKALTVNAQPFAPSGRHATVCATSLTVSTPSRTVPAGDRLSLAIARSDGAAGRWRQSATAAAVRGVDFPGAMARMTKSAEVRIVHDFWKMDSVAALRRAEPRTASHSGMRRAALFRATIGLAVAIRGETGSLQARHLHRMLHRTRQRGDRQQGGYRIGKPPPGERSNRTSRRRRSRGLRSRASARLR